jgi:hypothetical protein
MKTWTWAVRYGMAILLAIILGAILGSISLFEEATIATTGLTASDIVRFLGYGIALLLLWVLARQATTQFPQDVKVFSFLRLIIIPLATLIVVILAYSVVLLLLNPFLQETGMTIYNWVFTLGIVGAALWLAISIYRNSTLLIEAFAVLKKTGQSVSKKNSFLCPKCGVSVAAGMKFCNQCGQSLAAVFCRNCGQPLEPEQKFCGACGTASE